MSSLIEEALVFTLGNEGGYSNHPSDPGGATNFGIIQRELDRWNEAHPDLAFPADVKDLSQAQAEAIYRANYWRWDQIADPALAIKLFDIGVNCGPGMAIRLLQVAVNTLVRPPLAVDGQLGPATLQAVNTQPPEAMMRALCRAQNAHYQELIKHNPSLAAFSKGWSLRAARTPEVTHVV